LPEKILILGDSDLDDWLPRLETRSILEEAFASLGQKKALQPPQTLAIFPGNRGDFITYLGVLSSYNVFGAKLSPYIADQNAPLVTAWTILMSMETGRPLLLCDSSRLTRERTAATTALAVDKLAPIVPSILALIGSGSLAEAHLRHVASLRTWREIRVYSPNLLSKPQRLTALEKVVPTIKAVKSSAEAVAGAGVILLVTSSGQPVIDFKDISDGAVITSISTNAVKAHEIDPVDLAKMAVYCDYRETTPDSAGEMVLASSSGLWSKDQLQGDLPELCLKNSRPVHDRPVFFRSIGLGLEDVAIAYALYCQVGGKK